jgi:hypothetical protein
MPVRVLFACVIVALLSSLLPLTLTSAPVQACGMPIVIGHRPTGDTVAGTAQLVAEVKHSKVSVETVSFMVDGVLVATTKTPTTETTYSAGWDTTKVANGEHKWSAAALLADGSVLNSDAITVTVSNDPPPSTK